MTQPEVPPIPVGYWIARLNASNRQEATKAVTAGIDRFIDEFMVTLDAMQDALGIRRESNPTKRCLAYYEKPDELWDEQRSKFPKDWAEDDEDFAKLRIRASKGEFGPQLQAREIAYASEATI